MMVFLAKKNLLAFCSLSLVLLFLLIYQLAPKIGAYLTIFPLRKAIKQAKLEQFPEIVFEGEGIELKGWYFRSEMPSKGTIIYLHGVADNRSFVVGIAERFTPKGYDVIGYDSRGHGRSGGKGCTYGYYEKLDLLRVIDQIENLPIVLLGKSMGAAVALQTASLDSRIKFVIAAETFSDLETVVHDRTPPIFSKRTMEKFRILAESKGDFQFAAVSPEKAAKDITVPVLLIHGSSDWETPPDHSRRVYQALSGKKLLHLVPGAGHNQSLSNDLTWKVIEVWLEEVQEK